MQVDDNNPMHKAVVNIHGSMQKKNWLFSTIALMQIRPATFVAWFNIFTNLREKISDWSETIAAIEQADRLDRQEVGQDNFMHFQPITW